MTLRTITDMFGLKSNCMKYWMTPFKLKLYNKSWTKFLYLIFMFVGLFYMWKSRGERFFFSRLSIFIGFA
jgi:hypothetical protein